MIKIAHVRDCIKLKLPKEVIKIIEEVAEILDSEYGENRVVDEEDGGYIVVIESKEEFEKLNEIYIDVDDVILEFVDLIAVEEAEDYTNSLILCNNDFAISLIIPLSLTPDNLKEYILE